jgi:hypothetical protein
MFERQERTAILLLIGVAGTVFVATVVLGILGNQPFARPYSGSSADGELVFFEGTIDKVALTRSGGHMTLVAKNLSIFIPSDVAKGVSLKKGDRISLYGTVQTYRGNKEIIVNSASDVRISAISPKNL